MYIINEYKVVQISATAEIRKQLIKPTEQLAALLILEHLGV